MLVVFKTTSLQKQCVDNWMGKVKSYLKRIVLFINCRDLLSREKDVCELKDQMKFQRGGGGLLELH